VTEQVCRTGPPVLARLVVAYIKASVDARSKPSP